MSTSTRELTNLDAARQYLAAIQRGATGDELAQFFTPDVVQEELPNRVSPNGRQRRLAGILEGAERGQKLLSAQRGRTEVLIYPLASNGEPHSATVEWLARDTAAVSYYGGPRAHYAVDPRGRVLSVTDPRDGRHITVRLR